MSGGLLNDRFNARILTRQLPLHPRGLTADEINQGLVLGGGARDFLSRCRLVVEWEAVVDLLDAMLLIRFFTPCTLSPVRASWMSLT